MAKKKNSLGKIYQFKSKKSKFIKLSDWFQIFIMSKAREDSRY